MEPTINNQVSILFIVVLKFAHQIGKQHKQDGYTYTGPQGVRHRKESWIDLSRIEDYRGEGKHCNSCGYSGQ